MPSGIEIPPAILQECFMGSPRKCPSEYFRSSFVSGARSAPESALPFAKNEGEALSGALLWGIHNFLGALGSTPRGTFWESDEGTPKALVGALSGLPMKHSCKWQAGSQLCQEPRKGGFSKGGFCRFQGHAKGHEKCPRALGPAAHWALTASQPREAYIFTKTPF